MHDRKKVSKLLKVLNKALTAKENFSYAKAEMSFEFIEMLIDILKKQEPMGTEIEGGGSTWWYVCPECHGAVDTWDRFCKHCGQALRADEKRDPDGHPEEDEPDYP